MFANAVFIHFLGNKHGSHRKNWEKQEEQKYEHNENLSEREKGSSKEGWSQIAH